MRYPPGILSDAKREALHASAVVLLDNAFDSLATSGGLAESTIAWYLPERLQHHYHEVLYRDMVIAVMNVGGQLVETDSPTLRCVGEEFAMYVIIQHAGVWLETHGEVDEGWETYEDCVFKDMDFELLYDPAFDGIEDPDSDIAQLQGMANLHPRDWFRPFRPDEPVHPYYADE